MTDREREEREEREKEREREREREKTISSGGRRKEKKYPCEGE